jgi:threonine aldolase
MDNAHIENQSPVNFIYDGLALSPNEYLNKLQEINKSNPIEPDFYGEGGATKLLEEEFAKLTGKEKAIYLPTGTMANQLAIKLLNENNTKVIVPENAHIYRDEADAAQSVHNKRLIPAGQGKAYFDLADLKSTIEYTNNNEVFNSGLGTVVIENPVRRADGAFVPIETIKEISKYCKENNYKIHLDGARIHLASAFNNISLSEYASYFDTVYISLYKYLNATGGAILCGDAKIIDKISHQIKILVGTVFQSWNITSIALHYLNGISERWN